MGVMHSVFGAGPEIDPELIDALRDRPHPTHLSVGQALDAAARVKPESTYFTHICHDLPQAAESRLPIGAHIAYDGLKLTF